MSESATPAAPRGSPSRGIIRDVAIVIGLTLVSIVATSYLELDEWLYARTRKWELFQIDELPVTFIVLTLGLMWFSESAPPPDSPRARCARAGRGTPSSSARGESRACAAPYPCGRGRAQASCARAARRAGQYLNAIKLDAVAIRDAAHDEALASRAAGAIIQSVDHVHAAVSGMIRRLRPVGLDELGLAAAVESLVNQWRARLPGVRFSLAFGGVLDGLGEQLNLALFRLIQEGLTNCSRHAGCGTPRYILAA